MELFRRNTEVGRCDHSDLQYLMGVVIRAYLEYKASTVLLIERLTGIAPLMKDVSVSSVSVRVIDSALQ
jgi:hypothetical protein